MKKISAPFVLVFYCVMLILQTAALCFADEKFLEGKIMGTGPGKVWILLGSNQGVTEGMLFDVRHDDAVIGKIKIKKVSASSSEAEIIEIASAEVKISPGDVARWMLPPEFKEEKKEEPKTETIPATEVKKDVMPSTPTPVETKPEIKKEETVSLTPMETKKEEKPKKTTKKKSGGIFGKKTWLYAVLAGAAAFALVGKGKGSAFTAPTAESVSASSGSTPSIPF